MGFGVENPHLFRLLTHPALADKSRHPRLQAASARAFAPLQSAISAAQHAGSVNDGDAAVLSLASWAMVHGATTLLVDDQLAAKGYRQSADQVTDLVTTVLFVGLRP